MRIGFIGLGAMGAPMLRRLSEAHPGQTMGYDADAAHAATICAKVGAEAVNSVADIAEASDVLFSCVPDNQTVRAVYLGPGGVRSAVRQDTVTIDCSTVGPNATRDVCAGLAEVGALHLDASMLGSVKQAEEGTISFVVGGDVDAFARARPVLAACGQLIRHCGPSGAGNHMKLIHQTLVAGHAVAVAEAMGLCLETGADIETFYDIVTQGTGFAYSRYFENRVPRMRSGDFSPLFMLKFMLKDARLARDMAPDTDAFRMLRVVVETLEEADADGYGGVDFSAAMKVIEKRVGRQIEGGG